MVVPTGAPVCKERTGLFNNAPLSCSIVLSIPRLRVYIPYLYHVIRMAEKIILTSSSTVDTEQIGEDIGRRLTGGEIIELRSDLGGGKTTFTRGLVRGAGSTDHVASPTFTVSKVYTAPVFEIHHFDFYRLDNAGLMEHEVRDILEDPAVVLVVEWGEVVTHLLPENRMTIEIIQTSDDERELHVSYPSELSYLLEAD